MSVPANLLAFHGRPEDFEWTPLEPLPAPAVQPRPISADELAARMKVYVETIMSKPGWQEELNKKNREAKEAKRRARKKAA